MNSAVSDPDQTPSGFPGTCSGLQQTTLVFPQSQPSILSGLGPTMSWEARPLPIPKRPDPSFPVWEPRVRHQIPPPSCFPSQCCLGLASQWCLSGGGGQWRRDRRSRDKGGFGLGEGLPPLESGFPQSSGQSQEQPIFRAKAPLNISPHLSRDVRGPVLIPPLPYTFTHIHKCTYHTRAHTHKHLLGVPWGGGPWSALSG